MSILTDLILEVIGSGVEPSSDRGLVATFAAGSVVLASATVWLLVTFPDPIRQPEWGFGLLVGSLLCGAGGCLVSVLHLRRNESDRVFGLLCLASNVLAIGVPTVWMIAR
jgi:peptidoglycan/LPS O-acetylase OafA/YrhL